MRVLPTCMSGYHMLVWCPWWSREKTGVMDGWLWAAEPRSLVEQCTTRLTILFTEEQAPPHQNQAILTTGIFTLQDTKGIGYFWRWCAITGFGIGPVLAHSSHFSVHASLNPRVLHLCVKTLAHICIVVVNKPLDPFRRCLCDHQVQTLGFRFSWSVLISVNEKHCC